MQKSMLAEEDGTEVLVRELYKRLPDGLVDWGALAMKAPLASRLTLNNMLLVLLVLLGAILAIYFT